MQKITTYLCLATLLVNTTGLPMPRVAGAGTLPCGCDSQAREHGTCCCSQGGSSCCAIKKPSCCASASEPSESAPAPQATRAMPWDWVVRMAARDCLGLNEAWLQLANVLPPPAIVVWQFEWVVAGAVCNTSRTLQRVSHAPETPPPRQG